MPRSIKLLLVAGARPNFMKIAPLIHTIERWNSAVAAVQSDSHTVRPSDCPTVHPFSILCPLREAEGRDESRRSLGEGGLTSEHSRRPAPCLLPLAGGDPAVVFDYRLVHTGQHYDAKMSDVFFEELRIPKPDFCLDVGSGSHAVQTARVMERFEPVLLGAFAPASSPSGRSQEQSAGSASPLPLGSSRGEAAAPSPLPLTSSPAADGRPDWLVVVGDVNSTVACALVASKLGVKVAHVEAGLRSFDRTMPEEINRVLTDAISDLLLTPSEDGNANLRREGVPEHKIKLVGNIMIDSVVAQAETPRNGRIMEELNVKSRGFIYVTLHRPSNVDSREALSVIVDELSALSEQWPVVFPIHPRTRQRMADFGLSIRGKPGLKLVEPVGYNDSLALTEHARCVLTDSGGLQEESTFFRTPCLTLRPNTERPVTVTLGSNRLTNIEFLRSDLQSTLAGPERVGQTPPLWDGQTAGRVLQALLE